MLFERMQVLLRYIVGVINSKQRRTPEKTMISIRSHQLGTAQVDHGVLRQVSAIVATLPVMTESGFKDEFLTVSQIVARAMVDFSSTSQEYSDVQLTSYLANMTKTLATLNDVRKIFFVLRL
jgi:COP9 signalosome complex subunit 6